MRIYQNIQNTEERQGGRGREGQGKAGEGMQKGPREQEREGQDRTTQASV